MMLNLETSLSDLFFLYYYVGHTYRHLGGLVGLCLTAQKSSPNLSVLGPPECAEFFQSAKGFFTLQDFTVLTPPPPSEGRPVHEDATLRIDAVDLEYRGPNVMPAQSK